MANNVHMSIASWNLALNAAIDAPCASGKIAIYDSTGTGQPATPALGESRPTSRPGRSSFCQRSSRAIVAGVHCPSPAGGLPQEDP